MSLFIVIAILIIIGVALYLVENYIPMSPPIKLVLRVVVILIVVLWLLQIFGITGPSVPQVR